MCVCNYVYLHRLQNQKLERLTKYYMCPIYSSNFCSDTNSKWYGNLPFIWNTSSRRETCCIGN